MSHKKILHLSREVTHSVPRGTEDSVSSTKQEVIDMVKLLESKILRDPDKTARILSEWIQKGRIDPKK